MRIILVGGGSFIAKHLASAASEKGLTLLSLPHDADLAGITRGDVIVNFALNPGFASGAYDQATDYDLRAARAAEKVGARTVMLSTRRVYGAGFRWGARETDPAKGDDTAYGRNKAHSEAEIRALAAGNTAIFRLANIFGFEYDTANKRSTFFAQMLRSLKRENVIRFDMHPDTHRDFLPVEACTRALLARLEDGTEGTFNLGSGAPLRCGDLADWVMAGYGGGELVVNRPDVRDEFFLSMDRWDAAFDRPVDAAGLRSYCEDIGRRLQLEKS